MIAGKAPPIKLTRGVTFTKQWTWNTRADKFAPLLPVPLTGFTGICQIRPNKASQKVLLSLTTENGGLTLGGAAGTFTITITDVQSQALPSNAFLGIALYHVAEEYPMLEAEVQVYSHPIV